MVKNKLILLTASLFAFPFMGSPVLAGKHTVEIHVRGEDKYDPTRSGIRRISYKALENDTAYTMLCSHSSIYCKSYFSTVSYKDTIDIDTDKNDGAILFRAEGVSSIPLACWELGSEEITVPYTNKDKELLHSIIIRVSNNGWQARIDPTYTPQIKPRVNISKF